MKSLIIAFALLASSLPALAQDIPGKLIFSVEEVEWALARNPDGSKGPKRRTGLFYYYKEVGPGLYDLVTLTGYQLRDGEIVGVAHNGEEFVKKLRALAVSSFDVEKEMVVTREKQRASGVGIIGVLDGTRYRIRYDFNGVSIDYTGWNPGPHIDHLAPYSENLGHLKQLVDFFALNLGRREMGLVPMN